MQLSYGRIRSKSDRCHLVSAEFSPILQNVIRNDLSRGARRPLPSSIAARISSERDTPSGAPEPSLDVEADNLRERQLSGLAASSSQLYADMPLPRSPLQHVETCTTITLPAEVHVQAAQTAISRELSRSKRTDPPARSGVLRYEVPVPPGEVPIHWLRGQEAGKRRLPSVYFSPRRSSAPTTAGVTAAGAISSGIGSVAGVGAAWSWQGTGRQGLDEAAVQSVQRFLSPSQPRIRALGGARFEPQENSSPEWTGFGSYMFIIPRLELMEAGNCNIFACTLAWHDGNSANNCFMSYHSALLDAQNALQDARPAAEHTAPAIQVQRQSVQHVPGKDAWQDGMTSLHDQLAESSSDQRMPELGAVDPSKALQEYEINGQGGLDALLSALDGSMEGETNLEEGELTKIVLARKTEVSFCGALDPLQILETLQDRDSRAFQLMLQVPDGSTFLGSTPELLYVRSGVQVASEAVAATRPRGPPGDVQKDFWLAFDLLRSPKDHAEFTIVRDWVRDALRGVCKTVRVDTEKSVLKQGAVQHLYGRLSGILLDECSDAHLLAALHPTPAVCGRPREAARDTLRNAEPFDRGFYAGPFGWISGAASEFAVAIRSALLHPPPQEETSSLFQSSGSGPSISATLDPGSKNVSDSLHMASLYAGVGIVRGSHAPSEWQELDLKVRQFESLLRQPLRLKDLPNVNLLWARLMVEELCRLGINTFCIAPGSRSSPLAAAVAMQPTARILPCIDERSLAFFALGFGKAKRSPAVVITSSGTAVANLFPAVIEAANSNVPLLLLTADRPGELRDTGANQTIDQVKLFGGYCRWAMDVSAPDNSTPARATLTTIDAAVRHTLEPSPGPVHLNCQFREPLGPRVEDWSRDVLKGLERWELTQQPYTEAIFPGNPLDMVINASLRGLLLDLRSKRRGLVVVGEQQCSMESQACVEIANTLGWPLVTDALSGLKVGGTDQAHVKVINHFDLLLLNRQSVWPAIQPDAILQLGGRLTSKRAYQFLEWAASCSENPADWIFVGDQPDRQDASHLLSRHVQMKPSSFAQLLRKDDTTR